MTTPVPNAKPLPLWLPLVAVAALAAIIVVMFLIFLSSARGSAPGVLTDAHLQLALTGTFALITAITLATILAIVVFKMATDKIDLSALVEESTGGASLSRFQMLLFTFVIASLYVIYTLYSLKGGGSCALTAVAPATPGDLQTAFDAVQKTITSRFCLPTIPESVLGLIGISGGSYLVAKGIQTVGDNTNPANQADTTSGQRANPHS